MALRPMPYRSLDELLDTEPMQPEWPHTRQMIRKLSEARSRGYLTVDELKEVCHWKSSRVIHHIEKNSAEYVRDITACAFRARDECFVIEHLCLLKGVGVPMASALLMLTAPKRYAVIDVRVWEVLVVVREVQPRSQFDPSDWEKYIEILRSQAKRRRTTPRAIERTLFAVHQRYQEGNLYD